MFLWLKTLYRKRAVTWPFIFYTIIWTLSKFHRDCIKINQSTSTIMINLFIKLIDVFHDF
ncbi:hypothetical protein CKY07_05555 [Enterococcus faecium]|nr:hypothetical protein CKY07_05555 [Enterococcus faecium]